MISLGSEKVLTADFTLSTPKTVSSALLPAQTKNQVRMLLLLLRRALSLQTFATILTITQFGGRALMITRLQTQSTGRANLGTAKSLMKRALIPTQDLLLPQLTAPASLQSLKIRRVFRFQHSYSAAVVLSSLRWYISQRAGITVYS